MTLPLTMILTGGGLRSLVATALTAAPGEGTRVMLLHLHDQRTAAPEKQLAVRKQAHHYKTVLLEVEGLRPMAPPPLAMSGDLQPLPLVRAQLLLAGLLNALNYGATTLIWPVSCDGEFEKIAKAQEQLLLAQHLAEMEQKPLPTVQMPLLEFSDRQVLEVGQRLKAPWGLAWSCHQHALAPCRSCEGCRRRMAGFAALGLQDSWEGLAGNP